MLWPFLAIYVTLLLAGRLELLLLLRLGKVIWQGIKVIFKIVYFLPGQIGSRFKPKGRLAFPKLRFPRISLPRVKLPRIRLPLPARIDILSFSLGVATALAIYGSYVCYRWLMILPDPRSLTSLHQQATTKIYDRNGELLYEIYQDVNRTPVKLSQVPKSLQDATIAIEDKDFYSHPGVSLRGITRAIYNVVFRHQIQGGSTLTQQLVKTVFFSPEQTVERKVKEIVTALRVEAAYPKSQILEMYLNQISYGGTAYGVAAATEQYFGKTLDQLNLGEAAFLAGLPAAPTTNSPFGSNPSAYKQRQTAVLRRMVEDNYITHGEAGEALQTPLKFIQPKTDIKAPHFVAYVREELERIYGRDTVAKGGLRVTTALDLKLNDSVQQIITEELDKLKNLSVGNAAALVTKPGTGEILAMIGSHNYFDIAHDGQVNVTTSLRQPGSSIKPVNYATAFKKGLTPATVLLDVPTDFRVPGQPPYRPHNYDGKYHGAVQIRFALGSSYNIPAVRVLAINGVKDMMDTAYEMGISTFTDPSRYGLSLTLGGGEVKMTEMAVAFGTLANLGRRQDSVSILNITDTSGKEIYHFEPKPGPRVLLPEISYLISHILLDNYARAPAFGSNSLLVIPGHAVSVKTGTTDDLRDNWTIGYTPSFLAATWVGNNDNSPMNRNLVSGVTGAAPIWNRIMREVLKDQPDEWPIKPDGIIGMAVCALSGTPPQNNCPTRYEYFIKGTETRSNSTSTIKGKLLIAKTTGQPAGKNDTEVEEREVELISDPITINYCLNCGFYNSFVDVTKIPYTPIKFGVDNSMTINPEPHKETKNQLGPQI